MNAISMREKFHEIFTYIYIYYKYSKYFSIRYVLFTKGKRDILHWRRLVNTMLIK